MQSFFEDIPTRNFELHSVNNSKKIAIVGVGSLGSELCTRLATLLPLTNFSIEILLIDPDVLYPRNIPASATYRDILQQSSHNPFQRNKVEVLAEWLTRSSPSSLRWTPRAIEIADCGWQQLKAVDLLITCTDNISSRIEAAFAARMLSIPMIDGGVMGNSIPAGRVATYGTDIEAACYLCGLSHATRFAALAEMSVETYGCATIPEHRMMDGSIETSWSTQNVASKIAEHICRSLTFPQGTNSYEVRIAAERQPEHLQLTRAADCPWHMPSITSIEVKYDSPLWTALPSHEWCLTLPWPMAMAWNCIKCGSRHEASLRLGYARRKMACPHCSSPRSLTPERIVSVIRMEDASAQLTPRQLGLPKEHLLLIRKRITSASNSISDLAQRKV